MLRIVLGVVAGFIAWSIVWVGSEPQFSGESRPRGPKPLLSLLESLPDDLDRLRSQGTFLQNSQVGLGVHRIGGRSFGGSLQYLWLGYW